MSKKFTLHYHQPSEYQFSLDSVLLAETVADLYRGHPKLKELHFLDLCSGCGVIGLELYFHLREITNLDFLEVQEIYKSYFEKNLALFSPSPSFKLSIENYKNFSSQKKYDVILCNPPYFFKEEGMLSPSEFKNRCRFFLDASFGDLIQKIGELLVPEGRAFVLVNRGEIYGKDRVEEVKKILGASFQVSILKKVRITDLVEIRRG